MVAGRSHPPAFAPWLRRRQRAALAALVLLAACAPSGPKLPASALDDAIGDVIGDPATCVVLTAPGSTKVLYRYGQPFNCSRGLPACDRPGYISAMGALAFASVPGGRHASCPSSADGSRTVGWSEGRVTGASRPLVYSAVMEGQTALPGQEIAARLADAFVRAKL
jgi:hypothetical protein